MAVLDYCVYSILEQTSKTPIFECFQILRVQNSGRNCIFWSGVVIQISQESQCIFYVDFLLNNFVQTFVEEIGWKFLAFKDVRVPKFIIWPHLVDKFNEIYFTWKKQYFQFTC